MSTKISQLTSAVDVTANDLIQIVDVEDGVMAPSGTNKKATASLLANQLVPLINTGAIAGSKIADSGITSAKIADGTIVNADINASAAIAGTKISPDFGSQNIVTTGSFSAGVGSVISGSSSGDALRITQTGAGNAIVVEDSTNPDSSPVVVNQFGSVIIGHTSSLDITGANGFEGLQLAGAGTAPRITASYWNNDASGSSLTLAKSRGVGVGSRSAIQEGDNSGIISFRGDDGGTGDFGQTAWITSSADGNATLGSTPGNLEFWTTPSGSSVPISRVEINESGKVGVGTTNLSAKVNILDNSSSDAVRITQTGSGNAIVVEDSTNPDSSPFVVNQHGSLQVGFNQFLDITGYGGFEGLQLSNSGASTSSAAITMSRWSADGGCPVMTIGKSRGVGVGNREAVQNGDQIGAINFAGDDGGTGDFPVGARILAAADGTTGVGDLPSRLQFFTTPDGTSAPVEAMRITSAGNVGIGATSIEGDCLLKLESTTKGFRPPSMTTTQRNAISTPIAGLMVYNNTTNKLNFYNGSAWEAVTSSV